MAKHVHIYFAPRTTRDQAPGSVPAAKSQAIPPAKMSKLVEALMQALAARGHTLTQDKAKTADAGEWDESKHPRAEGGQFSSAQHTAAAENHQSAAAGHTQSAKMAGAGPMTAMHQKAAQAHTEAAEAHTLAAKHMDAGTGLGEEFSSQAHSKSYVAAGHSKKLEPLAGGNMVGAAHSHLKKIASDPKQPMAKRAEATEQLKQLEKSANQLADSPHAKVQVSGPSTGQRNPGEKFAGAMEANKGGSGSMESQAAAKSAGPAGDKPTQATAKGAKAATHQLLSSGHPFSVDELMKATGVTSKSTMMTALADLKNPKYAGALGALQIAKRSDGMYHVTTAPAGGFKAVGAASAAAGTSSPAPTPSDGDTSAAFDPHRVTQGSHPLSDFLPNQKLTAKGNAGAQYNVLGHNAEGKVVVQHATKGTKHAMDPADLKKVMAASPAPAKASASETGTVASKEELDHAKARILASGSNSAKSPEDSLNSWFNGGPNEWGSKSAIVDKLARTHGMSRAKAAEVHAAWASKQPKPGPDGKPMGLHPDLAAAYKRVAENPRTMGGEPGRGGNYTAEQQLEAQRSVTRQMLANMSGGTPGPGSANTKWKNEAGYGQPAGPNNPNPAFKKPLELSPKVKARLAKKG